MHEQQTPARRAPQRGSVLVVVMISLVAMVSLGSLTILTVRSGLSSTTHDRFKAIALFAAEAGVAVGLNYLRQQHQPGTHWGSLVNPKNFPLIPPPGLPGDGAKPGEAGNLFSPELEAWYEVEILNNQDDGNFVASPPAVEAGFQGFILGDDTDGRIILQVTGHGPNNAAVRLEVEVAPRKPSAPCITSGASNSGQTDKCGTVAAGGPAVSTPL